MKRRLYYMLPDVPSASAMLDELLLARIEERHIHFCANEGTLPANIPEVTFFQKTDLIHGVELGMLIGGMSGLIAGALFLFFPAEDLQLNVIILLLATVGGALFGSWMSGLAAATVPNSSMTPFLAAIRQGQVLLIVDVPFYRVSEIENLIAKRHP
ncbi:MAG: DUF1269 domain-containing protein, partial [Undibacterium sp.]|nr:DUF1269 domain-containing protein [Undibacterium sp.]